MTSGRRLPPLNALRAFEVAGRRLSFKAAADELGVTQGAVAQQVRALEKRLGFLLFRRQRRGVSLTERGGPYFGEVQRAFQLLTDATDAVLARRRIVTVSVTPTFASKCLIPNLPDVSARFPDIDPRILASHALSDLERDGVDLAVRLTKPPFPLGLSAEFLFSDMIVVTHPDLVAGHALPLAPEAIAQFTLLNDGQSRWDAVLDGHPAKTELHINQAALVIDAALSGQGLAMVNPLFVDEPLRTGRLIRVLDRTVETDLGYYLVALKRTRNDAAIATIARWIREVAGAELVDPP